MQKINRRKFILSTISIISSFFAFYAGMWWVIKVRKKDATDIIISILNKKLKYLKLDKKDFADFAKEFQERIPEEKRCIASWAGLFRPIYLHVDLFKISPKADAFRDFEERVVTKFLLSTDFFENNADVNRKIKYLGYFDPFETCYNPFARF